MKRELAILLFIGVLMPLPAARFLGARPDEPLDNASRIATAFEPVTAGCPIGIDLKNTSNRKLGLVQPRSVVKVYRGVWGKVWAASNLQVTLYVQPGETVNTKANLTFGCDVRRRYRFQVTDPSRSTSEYLYYPGAEARDWTRNTRFVIDLAKAF